MGQPVYTAETEIRNAITASFHKHGMQKGDVHLSGCQIYIPVDHSLRVTTRLTISRTQKIINNICQVDECIGKLNGINSFYILQIVENGTLCPVKNVPLRYPIR